MQVSTMRAVPDNEKPPCIGQLWDPNATECAGGPDPKYTHPKNGSRFRDKCGFFNECGARLQAQQIMSPRSLIRSQPTVQATPTQSDALKEYMQRKAMADAVESERARVAAAAIQQQQRVAPGQSTPYSYYPQTAPPQYAHPAPPQPQMMPVNYMMPGYLSIPEMRQPGQSIMGLLGREAIRAMGKSLGHTVANFFDMHPFRLPPPPPGFGGPGSNQ